MWLAPQHTFTMLLPDGNCSTYLTDRVYPLLLSSFCSRPNWPYLPLPTINNFPSWVRRAVWAPPQLIDLIFFFKFAIFLGRNWSDLSPWPNCPSLPNPQVYTSPFSVTTPEKLSPAEISTIFYLIKASTIAGSLPFLRPPFPSWP